MSTPIQAQASKRLRETINFRLSRFLKISEKEFADSTAELSLMDLANGIFIFEGQGETIGAYAGVCKFIVAIVGKEEAWRCPKKEEPQEQSEIQPEEKATVH